MSPDPAGGLTLLFDLDDTLLENDVERFLPAYLQLLAQELAPYAPPEKLVPALLAATRQMVENRRPDCLLSEVFDDYFYPALDLPPGALQAAFERFYTETFGQLKALARPKPGAQRLVETAFERGYRLAITTNPLFPAAAIRQRLEWAGLSPEKYPFAFVASFEYVHFSKPHPAFLAEVLARLGWPEGAVLAVGDSGTNDIAPARQLGLPAFWINHAEKRASAANAFQVASRDAPSASAAMAPSAQGELEDLLPWLERNPLEALQPDFSAPAALLAVLRATPAALDDLSRGLTLSAWERRPAEKEWSLTEILCHLRDVDQEVNLPRLQRVLHERNPFLPGMDTDPWADERQYCFQDGPHALAELVGVRLKLLDVLESLPEASWRRPARHAILGPTHLQELVGISASHDRLHVRQAQQALNSSD
jgi:FMN phosphatase YigB (HAD superfamily)